MNCAQRRLIGPVALDSSDLCQAVHAAPASALVPVALAINPVYILDVSARAIQTELPLPSTIGSHIVASSPEFTAMVMLCELDTNTTRYFARGYIRTGCIQSTGTASCFT